METCRKDRRRGLRTQGTKARKMETGGNKRREWKSQSVGNARAAETHPLRLSHPTAAEPTGETGPLLVLLLEPGWTG